MVRRLTRTIRSTAGISSTSPGPFWSITRPRRNTTARSYSRSTRTDAAASAMAVTAMTARTIRTTAITGPPPHDPGPAAQSLATRRRPQPAHGERLAGGDEQPYRSRRERREDRGHHQRRRRPGARYRERGTGRERDTTHRPQDGAGQVRLGHQ